MIMDICLGTVYTIAAVDGGFVNLAGLHVGNIVKNGNMVGIFSTGSGKDQQWRAEAGSGGLYLCSGRNFDYCLNMRTTGKECHVWNKNTCDGRDSGLEILEDKASGAFRICLKARGLYLTREGGALFWRRENGGRSQLFRFEELGGRKEKKLDMPLNFSQKYEKNNLWVKRYGCAMCCGLDVSAYYGESPNNSIDYFYSNYRNSLGYTWGAPSALFTRVAAGDYYGRIRAEIDGGRPVVLRISKDKSAVQNHFVVACGYFGGCGGADEVFVLDPAGSGGGFSGGYKTLKQAMAWNGGKYYLTRLEVSRPRA